MPCLSCSWGNWRALSQAAAKSAAARFRALGALPDAADWSARAAVCEQCPLRHVSRGISYCGRPFLEQMDRKPASDGCGCPTRDKAKDPGEHCPLDARQRPALDLRGICNCKWCNLTIA